MSPVSKIFAVQSRVATLDSPATNDACERGAQHGPGVTPQSLHLRKPCDIHKAATLHSKVFSLPHLAGNIKGLSNAALSLRRGGGAGEEAALRA